MADAKYDHQALEKKWQKIWQDKKVFVAKSTTTGNDRYVLDMFPYPSGEGLHVGHPLGYISTDIYSRFLRMQGASVLHPMGWDAFGLPAENAAIKKGIHPSLVIKDNIANFKRQLQSFGFSYDWSREIHTTDPEYYRWTQWIFLQLFKKGLAYEKEAPIWWCPKDKTGLANEEVIDGKCERCGTVVEKKLLKQWMLKITAYAQRLINDLDKLDWPENIKELQRNWIGRSDGAEVDFTIGDDKVTVFTTRPDTLFGATYLVLAPEHVLVKKITTPEQKKSVDDYLKKIASKSDRQRLAETEKEKTGVFTGAYAINPVNGEKIPVWIADYVLASYGTGAIMAVPGHDQRDFEFAAKFTLPISYVVMPHVVDTGNPPQAGKPTKARPTIQAIIYNPKTEKYLCLKWKEQPWTTFIVGGVEGGEDLVEAAKREILEETGYKNVSLVKQLGGPVQAEYYAAHKGENRVANATAFLFQLDNDKQDDVSEEEQSKHEVIWRSRNEITPQTMNCSELPLWLANLDDNVAYTGEGIMINSGQFDGLPSNEAREKIVTWLEQQGTGKATVNYKLRDWVFSRQRYWGEPIPLVHCEHCKQTVESTPHYLNFSSSVIWKNLLDGKKTVEVRALNPEESERFFGDIKAEDYIKGIYQPTGATAYFRVKGVKKYKSLKELFADTKAMATVAPSKKFTSVKELEDAFEKMSPGYPAKIEKNGLVTFTVKHVLPGIIPVPEKDLPLELPQVEKYEPTGTGESPLAAIDEWVNVTCRICGSPAKRETNTMPQWAGSCWYYIRFTDPENKKAMASEKAMKSWLPVNMYVGGAEHAVLHLLYARFWHKVLFDAGFIPESVGDEPFAKLKNQGLILGPDGEKMSKSRGNVISPDEIIEQYGADTLRMYEMFMGPFEDAKPWDTNGILGVRRFLDKVWLSFNKTGKEMIPYHDGILVHRSEEKSHLYIKNVTEGIENFQFNTCISDLMKWANEWKNQIDISRREFENFLKVLAPFAPHVSEELWAGLGNKTLIAEENWPTFDPKKVTAQTVTIAVQVNGKLRGTVTLPTGSEKSKVEKAAKEIENVAMRIAIGGPATGELVKVIFVQDKLINFVV